MITRATIYALALLGKLEEATRMKGGGYERRLVRIADLARRAEVPRDFAVKIVRHLTRAGILQARRGPGGGATWGDKYPPEISVLRVVIACDGPFRVGPRMRGVQHPGVFTLAEHAASEILRKTSLDSPHADVVRR